MTQGRKSKTVLALVSALAFVALAIPALAAAQAADDEYNLTLPGAGGSDSGSSTQSASGTTTGTGAKASSASTSGGAGTTGGDNAVAATAAGSSGDGSGAKREKSKAKNEGATTGGSQKGSNVASNVASPAPSAGSADAGGGVPIILIALAVVAAACVGAAAWRLRNRPDGGAGKLGTGAPPAPGKSQ